MISVGITGGIGSGKSTVSHFFELLSIPVYFADDRAKKLMVEDTSLKGQLIAIFGEATYLETGQINRSYLSERVFGDAEQLKKLNSIVHPAVFKDTAQWMQSHQDNHYVLYESAILFESGSHKMFDKTITVFAPLEIRVARVIQRDNASKTDVMQRVEKQMDDDEKVKLANFVIHNDGKQTLISQILNIHTELLRS